MNISRKNSIGFTVRNLRTHRRFCRVVGCAVSFFTMAMSSAPAVAATAVLGGSASLDQATGATLSQNTDVFAQFTSSSASAVLDWSKFNIGSGQEMNFNGAGTTFFNLVNATAGKSQIDGMISGNGSVWVINPNGIAFGANSTVNVGGLFAAAAGTIENADALRNGTVTMPSFSSFEGAVSSSSTSKFTANQVAMLGKTASVAGDFTGVSSLNIGAAGSMVVDEVSGGKISINVGDFATDPSELSVELGDLMVGDTTYGVYGGDLNVRAGNAVKITGEVAVGDVATVYTQNGDISVESGAEMKSVGIGGVVDLTTGIAEGGKGDIIVDGDVKADSYGTVYLYADYDDGAVPAEGNVSINGSVSADSYAQAIAFGGKAEIAENGLMEAAGGKAHLWGGSAVNVEGEIAASDKVMLYSDSGKISIGEKGVVHANGMFGQVDVLSGIADGGLGDIDVKGTLRADGIYGCIWMEGGYGTGSSGNIELSGGIKANYITEISSAGRISASGTVDTGMGQLSMNAKGGDLKIEGTIAAQNAYLDAAGDMTAVNVGNKVTGQLSAEANSVFVKNSAALNVGNVTARGGDVQISTQAGDLTVLSGATVETLAEGGTVALLAGRENYMDVDGSVVVNGSVKADVKDGTVCLYGGNGHFSTGGVTVNGIVSAEAGGSDTASSVNIVSGFGMYSAGDVVVSQSGKVVTDGVAVAEAGYGSGYGYLAESAGNVTVDGLVKGGAGVSLISNDGAVNGSGSVDAGSAGFSAIAYTGDITLGQIKAGDADFLAAGKIRAVSVENDFTGTVTADGQDVKLLDSNSVTYGDVAAYNGSVLLQVLNGTMQVNGDVVATKDVKLYSQNGDINIAANKNISAMGNDGFVEVAAGIGGSGQVSTDGRVTAAASIELFGATGVIGGGDVTTEGGALVIDGGIGSVELSGTVKAKEAGAYAAGSVKMNGADNDFGRIELEGSKGVSVNDKNDITVVNATAVDGKVDIQAGEVVLGGGIVQGAEGVRISGETGVSGVGAIVAGTDWDLSEAGEIVVESAKGDVLFDNAILRGETAKFKAKGDIVVSSADNDFRGVVSAEGNSAIIGDGNDIVLGDITATGGIDFGDGIETSVYVESVAGDITVGGNVKTTSEHGMIELHSGKDVVLQGTLASQGDVSVVARGALSVPGDIFAARGATLVSVRDIDVDGLVDGNDVLVQSEEGGVRIDGRINAANEAYVGSLNQDIIVNGKVLSDSTVMVSSGRGTTINGEIKGGETAAVWSGKGGMVVNGSVMTEEKNGIAMLVSDGDVSFSSEGTLSGERAAIVAKGNLIQEDANLPYNEGRVDSMSLRPAVSGETVALQIGGSIGNGNAKPFVIDGKAFAVAFGDMSLAAGNGKPLEGGDASSVAAAKDSAQYTIETTQKMLDGTLTMDEAMNRLVNPSDFDDNALLYAGGDMYLYTAGQLDANSYIGAGKNMTVSAAGFGDMSYLNAGGRLTVNNVGKPGSPQIAYFESVNGVEPRINNQPNDTVIFVDGRLVGGNTQIINTFGANEAFMVQTPELKSTQGIFGNPTFMHSDLDVANPLEVSTIDYMIQDIPRLTLSSDFPAEVDRNVEANGLSARDSIWFGQEKANAKNDESEEKSPEDDKPENDKAQVANTLASIR